MNYFENTGCAVAKLKWTGPSFAGTNGALIAREWLHDGTGVGNREAIAYSQSVTMLQNTNQAIILQGAGNPAYSIVTLPAHGTLTGTPPNVTYTPAMNFTGLDGFTFVVNKSLSNSTYYFSFRATNTAYTVWATNVLSFTTLPLPPTPVLPGSAITLSGGVPNFTFATEAGFKYRLVCKDSLTNVFWLPVIATPGFPLPDGWSATATGAPMSLSDTNSAGQPQRFYRLEAANP